MAKKITYFGEVGERALAFARAVARGKWGLTVQDGMSLKLSADDIAVAKGVAQDSERLRLTGDKDPDALIIGVTAGEARQIVEALRLVTDVQPTTGDPMGQRFYALADEIEGQLPVEPVDPVLAAARAGVAAYNPPEAENVLAGKWDATTAIGVAKAAIAAAMASADLCEQAGWPFAAPKREGK